MRVHLDPCVILHQRPYRETSLLLEAWSREYGRLGVVARGARRPRGGRRAALQPCRRLLLSWSLRGELATLTGTETAGPGWPLKGDALFAVFYLNELLIRLLGRQDPHPELFDDYVATLGAMEEGGLEVPLRIFEKRLLGAIGYGLELALEADGETPVRQDRSYVYKIGQGAIYQENPSWEDGIPLSGETLLALHEERLGTRRVLNQSRRLLQKALVQYTGPRPLETPAILRSLRSVEQNAGDHRGESG